MTGQRQGPTSSRTRRGPLRDYNSAWGLTADALVVVFGAVGASVVLRLFMGAIGLDGALAVVLSLLVFVLALVGGIRERAERARRWQRGKEGSDAVR